MLNLIPISRSLRAACVAVVLTTAFVALAAAPAAADVASDFDSSIASTGVIPDIDGLNTNGGFIILNTNNGDIYTTGYNLVTPLAGQSELVTEAGGGTAMLFNFSTFTVPTGTTVLIQGSRPAIISATGNITIDGTVDASPDSYCLFSGGSGCTPPDRPGAVHGVQGGQGVVTAGGGLGGGSSNNYASGETGTPPPTGGGGGAAGIGNRQPLQGTGLCCGEDLTGGGGGGGGGASPGQAGQQGVPRTGYPQAAGGLGGGAFSLSELAGGGGGGSGGASDGNGQNGGNGGGAVLFVTPDDLLIGGAGAISADGADGAGLQGPGAAGGGGGGGMLWFDVGGDMTNEGTIEAEGGEGGDGAVIPCLPPNTGSCAWEKGGSGAGGYVVADPFDFTNDGTIDVSDGNGSSLYGGAFSVEAATFVNSGSILGVGVLSVPEPSTWAMMALGFAGIGIAGRWRRRAFASLWA